MRRKVFPLTEISLDDRRDLGDRDNFYPIWTQLSRLAGKLSVYTLQNLHHRGKLYPVSGKTFLHMNRQHYLTCRNVSSGTEITSAHMNRPLVNKQNVVYKFECDLCDADYIGYTSRHLHQRIDEHRNSAIGRHVKEKHGEDAERIVNCFSVLRKCQGKYDCLLYEMLYIKQHKPSLNTQSDSIQANKVFV